MNLFTKFALCIVALFQLSLATDEISKDKRYPIYNIIASRANEYFISELLEYGRVHSEIWPKYAEVIASKEQSDLLTSEDYQEFSKSMEQVIEAVKNLEEDKENCDYKNAVIEKMQKVYNTKSAAQWREFDEFVEREKQMKITNIKSLKTALNEIYDQLPAAIEVFTQSLNEEEKVEYKDLLQWCERYITAKNIEGKYYFFSAISSLYPYEDTEKEEHCKWNILLLKDFNLKGAVYILSKTKLPRV